MQEENQKVAPTVPAEALGPVMTNRTAQRTAEMSSHPRVNCDSRAVLEGDTGRNGQRAEGRRQHAEKQPAADGEQHGTHWRFGCLRRPRWVKRNRRRRSITTEDEKVVEAPVAAERHTRNSDAEDGECAASRVQKVKVVDIPSVIRGPVRMWKDQKIEKSQVRDDYANVLTERTERQSTTVTPFRMKNFSAQDDHEVVSSDGVKRDVEIVAACVEGSMMAVEGLQETLETIVKSM